MLKAFPIRTERAGYFAGSSPGRWQGRGAAQLGLEGAVDIADLRALLGGCDPSSGARLSGLSTRRTRAGHELIIAAPKSVSLLATLGGDGRAAVVSHAHRAAVSDVMTYLERHANWTRRRHQVVAGGGLAVASFDHRRNAAGEPHLHSHSLIPNLTPSLDGWRCLFSLSIWEHRHAASALYFLAMQAHLCAGGLQLSWEPGPGGTPEVAGVPRAAILAASSRTAEVAAVEARAATVNGTQRAVRDLARKQTHNRRPDARWPAAVAAAGFDRNRATAILDAATGRPPPVVSLDFDLVERDLLARGSQFRASDAMEVVARHAPPGTTVALAEQWAGQVCERSRSLDGRRFLSPSAELTDQRVANGALGRRGAGAGVAVTALGVARWTAPALDPRAVVALERLVSAGHGVEVLGRGGAGPDEPPLVAQAAVIDAARVAWQAAGHRVAILPAPGRHAQWQALTALGPTPPDGPLPSVLVVDRADRLGTPQLATLLDDAARAATKVVLLEGGSAPARRGPRSGALAQMLSQHGAIDPGPPPPLEAVGHRGLSVDGKTTVTLSGSDALGQLLRAWEQHPRSMMVAAGVPETVVLNAAARRFLTRTGQLRGPEIVLDGRALREGERVMALARGAGALGTVTALEGQSATVVWDSGLEARLTAQSVGRLGYGYAATPRYALRGDAVLLGLGDGQQLGIAGAGARLAANWVVAPTQAWDLSLAPSLERRAERSSVVGTPVAAVAHQARRDLEAALQRGSDVEPARVGPRFPPAHEAGLGH